MKSQLNRGSWLLNVLILMALLIIFAAVILPMIKCVNYPQPFNCSSSMTLLGRAIKMYLCDWNDTFPTNRPFIANGKLGDIGASVKLTPPAVDQNAKQSRFKYGVNWVEGLYAYMEPATEPNRCHCNWRCPEATKQVYPKGSKSAAVTYVFNRNLIELREKNILSTSNLMMIRETDRLLNADLRPINNTTWSSKQAPISPFLTKYDDLLGKTECDLHGTGSHILFVDGHVELFGHSSYPSKLTKAICWDPQIKQWYNCANEKEASYGRIAITP